MISQRSKWKRKNLQLSTPISVLDMGPFFSLHISTVQSQCTTQEAGATTNALIGVSQHSETSQGCHTPKKYIALWHSPAIGTQLDCAVAFFFN